MNKICFNLALTLFICALSATVHAQFGLEDDTAVDSLKRPTTNNPVLTTPAITMAQESQTITLQDSIQAFREYQAAFLNNDSEYILALHSEPAKSKAADELATRGLLYLVNSDKEIVNWRIKCGACWEDENEGPLCALTDAREIPSDRGKYYAATYVFKKDNNLVTISERLYPADKRARKLKRKMKKNGRNCKLKEYDLAIGTPNERKSGLNSLLKGVGSVLRALGN